MSSSFSAIYIIGEGTVRAPCAKVVAKHYGQEALIIDSTRPDIKEFTHNLKQALIISVGNVFLFDQECIENNTVINNHNAYLPLYKGRHSHVWHIWNQEPYSGTSWHLVTSKVDGGDLLAQQQLEIKPNMTAFELLVRQYQVAMEILPEALHNLDNGIATKQDLSLLKGREDKACFHFARDLPNNGYLDLSWDEERLKRFIRATSMHKSLFIPATKVYYQGQDYTIKQTSLKNDVLTLKTYEGLVINHLLQ